MILRSTLLQLIDATSAQGGTLPPNTVLEIETRRGTRTNHMYQSKDEVPLGRLPRLPDETVMVFNNDALIMKRKTKDKTEITIVPYDEIVSVTTYNQS